MSILIIWYNASGDDAHNWYGETMSGEGPGVECRSKWAQVPPLEYFYSNCALRQHINSKCQRRDNIELLYQAR